MVGKPRRLEGGEIGAKLCGRVSQYMPSVLCSWLLPQPSGDNWTDGNLQRRRSTHEHEQHKRAGLPASPWSVRARRAGAPARLSWARASGAAVVNGCRFGPVQPSAGRGGARTGRVPVAIRKSELAWARAEPTQRGRRSGGVVSG